MIAFGTIKRNGEVKAMPIATHDRKAVTQEIDAHTREGSLYYSDKWLAYATLKLRGDHVVIRKKKGRPVGRDHINGIEASVLRQELAVSLPWRAQQILPPLPR